jgi:hypothetical protein
LEEKEEMSAAKTLAQSCFGCDAYINARKNLQAYNLWKTETALINGPFNDCKRCSVAWQTLTNNKQKEWDQLRSDCAQHPATGCLNTNGIQSKYLQAKSNAQKYSDAFNFINTQHYARVKGKFGGYACAAEPRYCKDCYHRFARKR